MTWHIVGVEGNVPDDAAVVWGAAAVSDGTRLYNNFTHVSMPADNLERLRDEKHLHVFEKPIEIESDDAFEELVVLMVNRQGDFERILRPDPGRLGGVVIHSHTKKWHYYVFASRHAFDVYATVAVHSAISEVLYVTATSPMSHQGLVRIALTLSPGHPELNALHAYLDQRPNVERLARASVRPTTAISAFDLFLAAMKSDSDPYELKYEHGAAQGGGLDVDVAIHTLRAVESANATFTPYLQKNFPFIKEVPPPRLRELIAASAELHFVPRVEGRSLGDRVARYLSIYLLQQALSGEKPPELASSATLQQALRTIARPTAETTLRQKRLSHKEREDVGGIAQRASTKKPSPEFSVLGIISGLTQDSRAELWVGPERRFFVSTVKDDRGEVPTGAEAISGDGRFLRRPCIFTLVRESTDEGAEQFHLRSMNVLGVGEKARITAIPSGVLPGAFVVDLTLEVHYTASASMVTPLGAFEGVGDGTLPTARRWLKEFRSACNEFEIHQDSTTLSWLPPGRVEEASSLHRVMLILDELKKPALATDVVAGINERFKTVVRVNNTRREVLHHPDLLTYVGEGKKVLALTERGRSHIAAYIAAGGATKAT